MKNLNLFSLMTLLLWTVLVVSSCKTAQKAGATVRLKSKSSRFLLKKLAANKVEADWLSAKARITYKDKNQTRKFTANFRYRKDSLIWLNVKKTSVEAVRIQISPDSFYLINRLDKEYLLKSVEAIEEQFNLPQRTSVDMAVFDVLQELLLGNPLFFSGSSLKSGIDEQEYTLQGKSEHFDSEYRLDGEKHILTEMNFLPDDERQYLKVDLDRSKDDEEYPKFSYFRTYKVNAPQQGGEVTIKVKFLKLELNEPKSIRFEIPKNYKRID